jgi:hypothetical protein
MYAYRLGRKQMGSESSFRTDRFLEERSSNIHRFSLYIGSSQGTNVISIEFRPSISEVNVIKEKTK